ncbi:MAG: Crp/Fnr family transcriptional regulator [Burkholderiaceae bacterium]|nr:Crp/Fnr family transcriptional regulator [Burkholderiaceae bacterium]
MPGPQREPAHVWMSDARVKVFRRGQVIVRAGSTHAEWIAISSGAACLVTQVAGSTRVAVAALWLGDVIGWGSPLGKHVAPYDVTALVDVVTINIPWTRLHAGQMPQQDADTEHLYAATETRLQEQIFMRLAGNGFQRLVSVLATLAAALAPGLERPRPGQSLSLPVAQACIGQLSGLSRRQTWIYLGQLADFGWVATARTQVTLVGLRSWLALMAAVEGKGLACIASAEQCSGELAALEGLGAAVSGLDI